MTWRAKVTAAGLVLAMSTGGPVLGQSKKPVSWWYEAAAPENQAHLRQLLVTPFNAANPEHSLSIDFRGSELDRQLRLALLAGKGPDIVYTAGPSYVAPMADAGQLLPLDDYASRYGWSERLLPVFLDLGKHDGRLYALPTTYEIMGLFYNKTLFNQNGWAPPKTIGELETLASAMMAKGMVPFAAGNASWRPTNEHFVSIVFNVIAGPDNFHKALNGEIPWTSAPFVTAIDTLTKWWKAGYFGPNYFSLTTEQAFAQIATGQAGLSPTGTWNFDNVPTYFQRANAEAGFTAFPSAEGVTSPIYPLGVGSTFSISATSKNDPGAAAVIDYVFSYRFYNEINTAWQGEWNIPFRDLSQTRLGPNVSPLYTETMKTLATAVDAGQYGYTTWTFLPPATNTYLVSGIEEVWLGRITTEDYLAEIEASFQRERAEGKVPAIPPRRT